MSDFLRRIRNSKKEEVEIIETIEEHEELLLPIVKENQDLQEQYDQIMFFYESGINQITAKLQILNNEFKFSNDRNPIENIKSRVKSLESITNKMIDKGLPLTMNYMVKNLHDIAGVRVICPFISDVYNVANMLVNQGDISVMKIKDYIKKPKANGYRSLHLIVMVDVYFSDHKSQVPVEVQIRTIAMNSWASLEHQLRYKKEREFTKDMKKELKVCAELMSEADLRMQKLAEKIPSFE